MTIIAIDMGHSSNRASVGIAVHNGERLIGSINVQFFQAINIVRNFLNQNHDNLNMLDQEIHNVQIERDIRIIIEAPLSYFYSGGNPHYRTFTTDNYAVPEIGYGWYYGAGALTALASIHFLNNVLNGVNRNAGQIQLFEGFVPGNGDAQAHNEVAQLLIESFLNHDANPTFTVSDGQLIGNQSRLESVQGFLRAANLIQEGTPQVIIPNPQQLQNRPNHR